MDYVINRSFDGILGLLFVSGQMMTLRRWRFELLSSVPHGYTFPPLRVLVRREREGIVWPSLGK